MSGSYLISGARTPIGKFQGSLSSFSAVDLGGIAIKEALVRSAVLASEVDYVFMGHVLQAGQGQITARQAATKADIGMEVPATTVNKVCLSGLNAIYLADLMIKTGEADIVIAGGMESMSQAPYLLPGARTGYKLGDGNLVDSMLHDGLFCSFDNCSMGVGTERHLAGHPKINRERQDHIAVLSHKRALEASTNGTLRHEIAAVSKYDRGGNAIIIDKDEGIRPGTSTETLAKLKPAFVTTGTITAGNASQISDGAAALIVMSEREVKRRRIAPLGQIISYGQVAGPDTSLLSQPSNAINAAAKRALMSISDISLFEINEAFAAVVAASSDDLGLSEEKVNVNGGAIALGHPIGASGARLVLSLLFEMNRRGLQYGSAALCGGGGQGDAIIIKSYQ